MSRSEAGKRDIVQSVVRGVEILHAFGASRIPLTLDEVSAVSGISRSASRRLLHTLVGAGMIRSDGHRYSPTPRLLDLGYASQSRLDVATIVGPYCTDLSARLGRIVSVVRLQGPDVEYLVRTGVPHVLHSQLKVGARIPAPVPMAGRVLLSSLDADQAGAVLSEPGAEDYLHSIGHTIPTYLGMLREVRERGWISGVGVLEDGVGAVAVPLRDRTGAVVAAMSVTVHATTEVSTAQADAVLPAMLDTAERISQVLHPSNVD